MRIDDVVRTERYFCALLVSLLTDDSLEGLRALAVLLTAKGLALPDLAAATVADPQVIAELAVKRDLQKYSPGVQLPAESPRDVVDVVVVVAGVLVAIEAK